MGTVWSDILDKYIEDIVGADAPVRILILKTFRFYKYSPRFPVFIGEGENFAGEAFIWKISR